MHGNKAVVPNEYVIVARKSAEKNHDEFDIFQSGHPVAALDRNPPSTEKGPIHAT